MSDAVWVRDSPDIPTILRRSLQNRPDQDEGGTKFEDCDTTKPVTSNGTQWECCQLANVLDCIQSGSSAPGYLEARRHLHP